MTAKLDYRWHLRQVMATRGMLLVVDRPERLSLKVLMALLDILDCTMADLVEPVPVAGRDIKKTRAAGGDAGVGALRPKRARIAGADS